MSRPSRIEQWGIVRDPYLAPERGGQQLVGKVDGVGVKTSELVEVNGLVVRTASGSVYLLGEPSPEYLAWCRENGIAFDPACPIKVRP